LQNGKTIEIKDGFATLPLEPFGVAIVRGTQPSPQRQGKP
jgi:hypothetical protein